MPTGVRYTTQLRYEIVQGQVAHLTVRVPAAQTLTKLQGADVHNWEVKPDGDAQLLIVDLVRPVEKRYVLTLHSEQTGQA